MFRAGTGQGATPTVAQSRARARTSSACLASAQSGVTGVRGESIADCAPAGFPGCARFLRFFSGRKNQKALLRFLIFCFSRRAAERARQSNRVSSPAPPRHFILRIAGQFPSPSARSPGRRAADVGPSRGRATLRNAFHFSGVSFSPPPSALFLLLGELALSRRGPTVFPIVK